MMTPELLKSMGLPETWQPTPVRWALGHLRAPGASDEQDVYVLVLDNAGGRTAFAFSEAEIKALATNMVEQASGLRIAHSIENNGHELRA